MNESTTPERVLVVGASGFVGHHVLQFLQKQGILANGLKGSGTAALPGVDITREREVDKAVRIAAPGVIVHLAGIAHKPRSSVSSPEYDSVNRGGTKNLLRAADHHGVRLFVYVSSASVYGERPHRFPITEEEERTPTNAYGRSKRDAEDACLRAAVSSVILRPPAIYSREWLLNLRKRAYIPMGGLNIPISIGGSEGPSYSLCAVENVVQAVGMAVSGRLAPGVYNVTDSAPYRQNVVADVVRKLDGRRVVLRVPGQALNAVANVLARTIPGDYGEWVRAGVSKLFDGMVLSTRRIEAQGFSATVTLYDLLRERPSDPPRATRPGAGT